MDSARTLSTVPATAGGTRTSAPRPAVSDLIWSRRTWLLLVTLCIVLALDGLDVSMVGVALPSIGHELGLGTGALQWIVSAYVLGYGALLLLGGRMADLLGRRKVFLVALSIFGLASLLGGLVSDPTLLIATRFIKGLAAAFTAPAGFSIITTNFAEGPARNKAISIYATFGASGYSLGLVVGGFMTELSWRWTFLVSVPVAALALILALRFIPRDRPAADGGHDVWGALTLALGMLGLVYTVVQAPDSGWVSLQTVGGFVLSAVILALFGVIETRTRHPLIRFGILKEGWVARANLSAVALFGSYLSFQFIVTLYLQSVLGWAPLAMALALLPAGLLVVSSAPFADKLIDRFGATRLIVVGLTALAAGYLWFLRIGPEINYVVDVLPSVLLLGVGFALGFPAINVQATAGIEDDEQGLAAGLIQSSTQVGAALVLAVTTAIVTSGSHGASPTHDAAAMLAQFKPGLVLSMVVAVAGLVIAILPQRRGARA
ncbi:MULTISPECIES: MFS transporter [Arthrobacter]|uniref:MFS transporter n=2 Tax=Arthrobacter TaxID=1663 RepID=A0ABU9KK68_9MICC|nr:MFS transporter [Arthrobacter sp. YJM1]MDP5227044.1 MFS transporter [Arthrobacter sp. YJM1]